MEHNYDKDPELPEFANAGKQHPFTVPEGYFERLPDTISDKLQHQKGHRRQPVPRFVLAAACLAIALFLVFHFSHTSEVATTPDFEITPEHLSAAGYVSEIDENMLVEAISADALATPDSSAIQDYLIDQKIDISLIIKEL
ncbi:MAG TPA: hypothetical protein VFW78_12895 [Bacteroidia bacterium]|nr:hypothetical protein [Bacteroidia bacterium]